MRRAFGGFILTVVVASCGTDKRKSETDVSSPNVDSTPSTTSERDLLDGSTFTSSSAGVPSESGTRTMPLDHTSLTSDSSTSLTPTAQHTSANPSELPSNSGATSIDQNSGPTRCTSHDDCEAEEVCVDPSTRSDCGEGMCLPGIVCGAPSAPVCNPTAYTLNDEGEVVPDDRWKGRLCYDCQGISCAANACYRCIPPP
jgi:hypothetical protein